MMSAPIGPAPITSTVLPLTWPARPTPCQATDAGSITAAVRRLSPFGSDRSIRVGSVAYRTKAPSVCGNRAADPR